MEKENIILKLGEGWDAPAVNSLILASYVGSFMLSNQMRGRAIRKSREQNKTANIWHLASLARLRNNELDSSDLETLQRRFKSFVGIAYYDNLIQDGIERLSIINNERLKINYKKVNEEMYKLALNRNLMASRWKKILDIFGGTNIKMIDKLSGDFKINNKIFVTIDFKKMLWTLIITNSVSIFLMSITSTAIMLIFDKNVVLSKPITYGIINIIIALYYLLKIIRYLNPLNYMKEIGKTILNSMVTSNKLLTNKNLVSNEVETIEIQGTKFFKVYLKGATVYENNLFIKSFEEVYNKVIDTRYIICVKKKNQISKDSYFNVPSILDNDKETATLFLNEWNKNVCKGNLIYTKSKEGRKMLLKARKNSLHYNEKFFIRKEASRWE